MNLKDFNDNWLHKDLPDFFRVKLQGADHPPEFQQGDLLTILNFMATKPHEFILIKREAAHEIVSMKRYQNGSYSKSGVIGTITSYERSCNKSMGEIYLGGEEGEELYPPDKCRDCDRLHIVEKAGKEVACCLTSLGMIELLLKDVVQEALPNGCSTIEFICTNTPDNCLRA
jgi:hypothetical protein